ncbi:hypothetical protein EON68_02990, partial [archaeon]
DAAWAADFISNIFMPRARVTTPQLWALGAMWEPASYYPTTHLTRLVEYSFGSERAALQGFAMSYFPNWAEVAQPYAPHLKARNASVPRTSHTIWLQSNCASPSGRHQYVRALMSHMRVDSFGGCLQTRAVAMHPDRYFSADGRKTKLDLFASYKFALVFENSVDYDYVSEKVMDAWSAQCVPVYWGAPNVEDYLPGPRAYIDARAYSPAQLAALLDYLDRNHTAYMEYHAWRAAPPDDIRARSPLARTIALQVDPVCDICARVHAAIRTANAGQRPYPIPARSDVVWPPPQPSPKRLPPDAVTDDAAAAAIALQWPLPAMPSDAFIAHLQTHVQPSTRVFAFTALAGDDADARERVQRAWRRSAGGGAPPLTVFVPTPSAAAALPPAMQPDMFVAAAWGLSNASCAPASLLAWRGALDTLAAAEHALLLLPPPSLHNATDGGS